MIAAVPSSCGTATVASRCALELRCAAGHTVTSGDLELARRKRVED